MDAAVKPRPTGAFPYLVAALSIVTVTAAVVLFPLLKERGAFVLYLATVALATWLGGWRPGIATITVTAFLCALYVLPPEDSLYLSPPDLIRLCIYLGASLLIAWLHTSRERALVRASHAEQRLAFALKCANMGAWSSDLKTGRFWWSAGMEQLFGRPPGQFSGTYEGFIGYIHPDDQDFVRRAVTRTIEGGREFEIEHRIVRPDGQMRWIITHGRIVVNEALQAQQVIGVAVDITARREREALAASAQPSQSAPA
jgi:PAS domain S-box-containing protein